MRDDIFGKIIVFISKICVDINVCSTWGGDGERRLLWSLPVAITTYHHRGRQREQNGNLRNVHFNLDADNEDDNV